MTFADEIVSSLPRLRTCRNTGNKTSCMWHICIDTKLCKLLIKISLNQNINIKDAIISGVPDLRDIFAKELVNWYPKLMSGCGSANFRICEYKYSGKNSLPPKSVRIARFPDNRGPDMRGSTVKQLPYKITNVKMVSVILHGNHLASMC